MVVGGRLWSGVVGGGGRTPVSAPALYGYEYRVIDRVKDRVRDRDMDRVRDRFRVRVLGIGL